MTAMPELPCFLLEVVQKELNHLLHLEFVVPINEMYVSLGKLTL